MMYRYIQIFNPIEIGTFQNSFVISPVSKEHKPILLEHIISLVLKDLWFGVEEKLPESNKGFEAMT